jgi:hypothetical protein
MRYLLTVVLVSCLAGCGTPQQLTTSGHDFSAHGRRVYVRPVELILSEERFTEVDPVPRPDWVSEATPRLQEALAVELVEHGAQVVTDPEAEADYVLAVRLDDWFNSPGSMAAKTAFVVIMVPLLVVMGAPGPPPNLGGMGPPSSATATLEVQGTHNVVWQVVYTSGIPDVRTNDGAKAVAQLLLRELPWSQ